MAEQGMFGSLYGTEREDQKERMRREFARMTPDEQLRYSGMRGAEMAGQGISDAITGALGGEPAPEQKRAQAAKELQQLAQTVQPGTMDFYKQAIAIMQKYGMVEEAARFQDAIAKLEQTQRTIEAPVSDIGKLEHDRKIALDRYKDDPAAQARVNKYFDDRAGKLGTVSDAGGLSGTAKLQRDRAAALARGDTAAAGEIDRQIQANAAKAEGAMTESQKAADVRGKESLDIQRREEERKVAADALKERTAKAKADAAMATVRQSLERSIEQSANIDKFAREAMPLVPGNVGSLWNAARAKMPGSPQYALERSLDGMRANIGFKELQDMRNAAKTGGALGQVSDFENKLLQSVKGSLDTGQPEAQMLRHLRDIILQANDVKMKAQAALASKIEMIEQPGTAMPTMSAPAPRSNEPGEPAAAPAAGGRPPLSSFGG